MTKIKTTKTMTLAEEAETYSLLETLADLSARYAEWREAQKNLHNFANRELDNGYGFGSYRAGYLVARSCLRAVMRKAGGKAVGGESLVYKAGERPQNAPAPAPAEVTEEMRARYNTTGETWSYSALKDLNARYKYLLRREIKRERLHKSTEYYKRGDRAGEVKRVTYRAEIDEYFSRDIERGLLSIADDLIAEGYRAIIEGLTILGGDITRKIKVKIERKIITATAVKKYRVIEMDILKYASFMVRRLIYNESRASRTIADGYSYIVYGYLDTAETAEGADIAETAEGADIEITEEQLYRVGNFTDILQNDTYGITTSAERVERAEEIVKSLNLTARELQVLNLTRAGGSINSIAEELKIDRSRVLQLKRAIRTKAEKRGLKYSPAE